MKRFPTFVVATPKAGKGLRKAIWAYNTITDLHVAIAGILMVTGIATSTLLLHVEGAHRLLTLACTGIAWGATICLAGIGLTFLLVRRAVRRQKAVEWAQTAFHLIQYSVAHRGLHGQANNFLEWISEDTRKLEQLQNAYEVWQKSPNSPTTADFLRTLNALTRHFRDDRKV